MRKKKGRIDTHPGGLGLSAWSGKPKHIFSAKFPPHFHAKPYLAGSWNVAANAPFSEHRRSATRINRPWDQLTAGITG